MTAPWHLPPRALLAQPANPPPDTVRLYEQARAIERCLRAFDMRARVVEVTQGPTVTQFSILPPARPRGQAPVRLIELRAHDLALALAVPRVRVVAPVPGRPLIGLEIRSERTYTVALRAVMDTSAYLLHGGALPAALGLDVQRRAVVADLAAMPHCLIAGATGSGKSVCINALLTCLLMARTPDDLRLALIDPKQVELTGYNGIPHLLTPVITDPIQAAPLLAWLCGEMEARYTAFARVGARDLAQYNAVASPVMPYVVAVIDELADLMQVAGEDTERYVVRIAQMARATGIHLVIATQRPSVDVVTGTIKANFPARIAFRVASNADSRVVLDAPGAEALYGAGDMLYVSPAGATTRLQGCYVSDGEIAAVVRHWQAQGEPGALDLPAPSEAAPDDDDDLLERAEVAARERASISHLQRVLRIGYQKAARLMAELEARSVVSAPDAQGRRRVRG